MWTVAAKKAAKWCRGVLEAAERFVVNWEKDKAEELSRQRYVSVVGGALGNGSGVGQEPRGNRG